MPAITEFKAEGSNRTFRLGEKINEGNYGLIYEAWEGESPYAVKLPKPLGSRANARRLAREANIQTLFSRPKKTPHIVPVVLSGTTKSLVDGRDTPFLVMPRTQSSLEDRFEMGLLSPREAMTAFEHTAAALVPIHERRVAHGDVSMANVLNSVDDQGYCEWLLGDWGSASFYENWIDPEGDMPRGDPRHGDQLDLAKRVIFPVVTGVYLDLEDHAPQPTLNELVNPNKMNIFYENLQEVVAKIFGGQYPATAELHNDLLEKRKKAERIEAKQRRLFT